MDALFPASMSLGAFGMMMPKLSDVRAAGPGSSTAADLRMGEFAAAAIVLAIGAIVTVYGGNKGAIKVALIIVVLMAVIYEIALRIDPNKGVN